MRLLFKISGFILIILTTTAIGFLKSNTLNIRYKKLCNLKGGISDLKQRIRMGCGEIDKLVSISFKDLTDYYGLEKNDIKLIETFFKEIGMLDTESECERCDLYISLLDTQIINAQKNCQELGKLYKSIGFMSGLFFCIFFL